MVIRALISKIAAELDENAVFEARQIVMRAADMTNTDMVLRINEQLTPQQESMALEMARRRVLGEPLQYILGFAEFMGLRFEVNRNVLIPRADTETLVETVLNEKSGGISALDIGTGSGCVGISIAHFNKNARVTLLDISRAALDTAKKNAKNNCVNCDFINMDILSGCPHGQYDVIVSNPPYIRPEMIDTLQTEVKDFEPYTALCGGEDGLVFYRRIVEIAPRILNRNGLLAFEIGYDQGEDAASLMRGFDNVRVIKDLCGNDRVVTGVLK